MEAIFMHRHQMPGELHFKIVISKLPFLLLIWFTIHLCLDRMGGISIRCTDLSQCNRQTGPGCALPFGRMGMCTISVISHFPTNIHHTSHLIRPVNKEELYNLQHAQAWNVVKHIFGVLKHWFHIYLLAQNMIQRSKQELSQHYVQSITLYTFMIPRRVIMTSNN